MNDKPVKKDAVRLADILCRETGINDEPRILLLGAEASLATGIRGSVDITRIADIAELDASDTSRYDVALITNERLAAFDGRDSVRRTVAALRDRHARVVIVIDEGSYLELTDYLALGFERLDAADTGRAFILDPDSPSRQREWNDARNWANPENFDKFRW